VETDKAREALTAGEEIVKETEHEETESGEVP